MLHHPIFLKENPCRTWITRFPPLAAKTVKQLAKQFSHFQDLGFGSHKLTLIANQDLNM